MASAGERMTRRRGGAGRQASRGRTSAPARTEGSAAERQRLREAMDGTDLRLGAEPHAPPFAVGAGQLRSILDSGEPLPEGLQADLTGRLAMDFSRVRIHADATGDHVARVLGADAVSFGGDIAFRQGTYAPDTSAGRELILHEARHVAAGAATGSAQQVQLKVSVDDVTEEMVGLSFTMRTAQGTAPDVIPAGATVVVTDWKGTGPDATVRYTAGARSFTLTVPKLSLQPAPAPGAGVRRYTAGLSEQQRVVEQVERKVGQQEAAVSTWQADEPKYSKKHAYWEQRLQALTEERDKRRENLGDVRLSLTRLLVRETQYNRFDASIARWVAHYNAMFRPPTPLDPNLVKSMIFQESRMGTKGEHLELPPYDWADPVKSPIRSRFNVMQSLDSFGHQQLLMLEEMAPVLFAKYNLADLKRANRQQGMSNTELASWNGAVLSSAIIEFFGGRDASGKNAMGTPGKDLHEDYDFWIRTAIRWLFYKYFSLEEGSRSWAEAARAYNGSGRKAEEYREKVMSRVGGSSALEVGSQ